MARLQIDQVDSPLGRLTLVVGPRGVCALDFDDCRPRLERFLWARYGEVELESATDPNGYAGLIRAYFGGKLTVLDNQVDPTTGTLKLKAEFPNPKAALWPGAFVTVRLKTRTLNNATVVPTVAIQRGPTGTFVWTVDANKKASRRPVTAGHEEAGQTVLTAGIKPGEQVVIDGASRLTDDATVAITQPAGTVDPATPVQAKPKRPTASAQAAGPA